MSSYNLTRASLKRRSVGTDSGAFSRGEHPRRSSRTKAHPDAPWRDQWIEGAADRLGNANPDVARDAVGLLSPSDQAFALARLIHQGIEARPLEVATERAPTPAGHRIQKLSSTKTAISCATRRAARATSCAPSTIRRTKTRACRPDSPTPATSNTTRAARRSTASNIAIAGRAKRCTRTPRRPPWDLDFFRRIATIRTCRVSIRSGAEAA